MSSNFNNLFVWNEGKIEDVQFWREPELAKKAIQEIRNEFEFCNVKAFVALEARGFYLAGMASSFYNLPSVMIRKHKSFFENMPHERIHFKNWKGEPESLTVIKKTLPTVDSVLLVDDILDTGASLRASIDLLERIGIKICGAYYLLNSYGETASSDFGIPVRSLMTRKLFT